MLSPKKAGDSMVYLRGSSNDWIPTNTYKFFVGMRRKHLVTKRKGSFISFLTKRV